MKEYLLYYAVFWLVSMVLMGLYVRRKYKNKLKGK
tara:strand:- start:1870 stop:1974 length:105 start_codon:yes stop_codon:yes gene_type:complete